MRRFLARAGAVLAAAVVVVFGVAAPASAHVTVNPQSATQGGYTKLTFRVPNEKADASTVRLEVVFPEDAPLASVSVRPLPGWTAQVQRRTLDTPVAGPRGAMLSEVVDRVVWTASAGAEIGPGQFQEFEVSAGPLPEVDQMILKALQGYSDGDTVAWIDEPSPGVDLEHPAPILTLLPDAGATPAAAGGDSGGGGAALGFGIAGTVLGLAGLVLGLLAYRRSPRT